MRKFTNTEGEIVIATSDPDPYWRTRRGSHRKK
jgi:hypothetical protein